MSRPKSEKSPSLQICVRYFTPGVPRPFLLLKVTEEMVRQLSATAFFLLDALCRNDKLSRSMWELYQGLFASDVGNGGQGFGK